jgi:hypothetical protein
MMPELPYPNPDGYCQDCKEHIRENDFFGFLFNGATEKQLYCANCYGYNKAMIIRKRHNDPDLSYFNM